MFSDPRVLHKWTKVQFYSPTHWLAVFIFTAAIFPPLGIILTVIFFLARIDYIMENWKALLAGVLVYAYPFVLGSQVASMGNTYGTGTPWTTALFAGAAFHFLLVWLYHNKFSTKNALGAIGAAPLFFIMLILPLVAQDVSDVVDYGDYNDFEASYDAVDYEGTEIHTVKGHWRQTPDGGYTYLDPHIRISPDGIESNNITYRK